MISSFTLFGLEIQMYGICIVLGLAAVSVAVYFLNKKHGTSNDDSILLYAYGVLFGFIGAKSLYLVTIYQYIDWSRIFEWEYLTLLMSGGYVFYGGLVLGTLGVIVACYFEKKPWEVQFPILITGIPLAHAFGRIGCALVGCCYGIPYDGIGSITYTHSAIAPNNVALLPTQLIEVCFNLILFSILFYLNYKKLNLDRTVIIYFMSYGIYRFIIEYFRYDAERGKWLAFSTSQWISLFLIFLTILYIIVGRKLLKTRKEKRENN